MSSTSEVTIGGLVGTRWKPALSVQVTDGIAIITFDLPNESVNKLNRAVKDEFVALVSRLERDTTVHAAVFISGKPDVWIAGADIEEFLALKTASDAERLSRDGQMLLDSVERPAHSDHRRNSRRVPRRRPRDRARLPLSDRDGSSKDDSRASRGSARIDSRCRRDSETSAQDRTHERARHDPHRQERSRKEGASARVDR